MVSATIPRAAEPLVGDERPTLAQVRILRRVASQDAYERKELLDLHRKGLSCGDKAVRGAILAYALDFLADADEALPDGKDAYVKAIRGLLQVALDDLAEATTLLKAAAKDLPDAKCELVRVLVARGELDDAEKLIDDLPGGAEAHFLAGLVHEARGGIEKAINAFEATLEQDPEHVEAAFKLGVLLDRIGDDDMAIEHYLVCADAWPHYLPGVMNLGMLYDERGEANAAIDCFRQVLAYNPDNRRAAMLLRDSQSSRTMFYDEKEERERERMEKILKTPVNDFELSVRSRNCLAKMNIFTLGDLISITEQEMLNYKNFGETSLKEVREMLDARNLRLGMLREHDDKAMTKADQKMLGETVEKLELSSRSNQVLETLGAAKIADVVQHSDLELYRVPGSGQSVVQELSTALGAFGLGVKKPEVRV